jgi:hypothetical protein
VAVKMRVEFACPDNRLQTVQTIHTDVCCDTKARGRRI